MTAHNRRHRREPERIGVVEQTGKAVLIHNKLQAEYGKADIRQQTRQTDDPQRCAGVHDKAAHGVQLTAEVEVLFGMDGIKDEEADRRVQQHDHVVQVIQHTAVEVQQDRHHAEEQKKHQPEAVTRPERGAAGKLAVNHQKNAPQEHDRQRRVSKNQHRRDITHEQTDNITAPEERSVCQR